MDHVVGHLEKIYTTIDWPFIKPINENLKISLYQSGKSRADLWQFAGLVALEQAIERANRACDLDYFAHQQVFINRMSIMKTFELTKKKMKKIPNIQNFMLNNI